MRPKVGEAFRPLIAPRLVLGSYAVSVAYVLGDTYDKAALAGRQARAQGLNPTPLVMTSALDVLSWQSIASVAAPGLIINRAVAIAGAALRAVGRQPGWAPTIIGLAAIPLIVKPIDALTDALLDRSLRPAIEEYYRRRGKRD